MVVCLGVLLAAGCGERRASVTGLVTLDGEPLAGSKDVRALVQFCPTGGGRPATGSLDGSGRYRLAAGSQKTIKPGTYAVTISATQIIYPDDPDGTPSGRRISPRRYADAQESGWERKVEPGPNTFDFDLESD